MTIIVGAFAYDAKQHLSFGMLSIDDPTRTFAEMVQDVSELGIFGYTSTLFSDAPYLSGIKTDEREHLGAEVKDRNYGWFITDDKDFFDSETN